MFTSHKVGEEMVTPFGHRQFPKGIECVDTTTIDRRANLVINVVENLKKTKDLKIPHTQIQKVKIVNLSEPLPSNITFYIENFNNYIDSKKIYEILSHDRGVFGGIRYNKFTFSEVSPLKKFRILGVRK